MIREKLLHFIWQNQLLEAERLVTTNGERITIKSVGLLNHDAGPDFKNAQVQIGDELWAGHVEIHVNAKDWLAHGHQHDDNYKNVVLHVVLFNNDESLNIPTLELNGKIKRHLLKSYEQLMESKLWIPCANKITDINSFSFLQMKDRLVIERLERKIEIIKKDLRQTHNNWDEAFYRNLMRYAGLKVNKHAFSKLAQLLPFKLISKHRDDQFQIEALLFGVGGFLNELHDEYQKKLQKEYNFLKHKYSLNELKITDWQFATLRPANFPTVRLAQLATLFSNENLSFQSITRFEGELKIAESFKNIQAGEYWDYHYHFAQKSKTKRAKKVGNTYSQLMLINHFVPILYVYGWYKGSDLHKEKAIDMLTHVKPEINTITKKWADLGLDSNNAFDSQALIELKTNYCELKKCLNCSFGNKLLRQEHDKH